MSILKTKNYLVVAVLLGATSGYSMDLTSLTNEGDETCNDRKRSRASLSFSATPAHCISLKNSDSDSDSDSDCHYKGEAKSFMEKFKKASEGSLTITAKSSTEVMIEGLEKGRLLRKEGNRAMREADLHFAMGIEKRNEGLKILAASLAASADFELKAHVDISSTIAEVASSAAASSSSACASTSVSKALPKKRCRR